MFILSSFWYQLDESKSFYDILSKSIIKIINSNKNKLNRIKISYMEKKIGFFKLMRNITFFYLSHGFNNYSRAPKKQNAMKINYN